MKIFISEVRLTIGSSLALVGKIRFKWDTSTTDVKKFARIDKHLEVAVGTTRVFMAAF